MDSLSFKKKGEREGTLGFGFVRKEGELSKESERERFLFLSGE